MSVELENTKAANNDAASAQPLADLPTLDLLAKPSSFARSGNSNLLSPLQSERDGGNLKTLVVADPYRLSMDLAAGARAQAAPPKNEHGSLKLSDPYANCPRPACPFDGPVQKSQTEMAKIPTLKEQLEQLQVKEKAKTDPTTASTDSKEQDLKATTKPNAETKPPAELKPPADAKPITDAKPSDKTQTAELVEPRDGKGGQNAVQNYEQKQGARIAGTNVAPPLEIGPRTQPSNTIPGTIPDSRPSKPSQPQDSFTPFTPGDNRPIVPASNQTDGKPLIPDANVKPAFRPDATDVRDQLKNRYETHEAAEALKMAKELGLPLAVHVGASWCGPCRAMESGSWPAVEGTANKKGSLQGKMVTLHIDVDDMKNLSGENAKAAQMVASNPAGYPTIRVFNVDASTGKVNQTIQKSGGMSAAVLTNLLQQGGIR